LSIELRDLRVLNRLLCSIVHRCGHKSRDGLPAESRSVVHPLMEGRRHSYL
jgi:hypothetical protein